MSDELSALDAFVDLAYKGSFHKVMPPEIGAAIHSATARIREQDQRIAELENKVHEHLNTVTIQANIIADKDRLLGECEKVLKWHRNCSVDAMMQQEYTVGALLAKLPAATKDNPDAK